MSAATILTLANGRGIDLRDPRVGDIDFAACAEHLAKEKRYNGATPGVEYSVAEHLVRGTDAVIDQTGDRLLAAYFSLHDVHESFLKDDTTPKKRAIAEECEAQFGVLAEHVLAAFHTLEFRHDLATPRRRRSAMAHAARAGATRQALGPRDVRHRMVRPHARRPASELGAIRGDRAARRQDCAVELASRMHGAPGAMAGAFAGALSGGGVMTQTRRLLIDAEYPEFFPLHRWGERVEVVDGTPSGCPQGERACKRCGLVKVTVHPPQGYPWREWRPQGGPQIQLSTTPPCVERGLPLSGDSDSVFPEGQEDQAVNPRNARYPQRQENSR